MKSHGNPFNSDPLSTLMYFVSQAVTQIHRAESWWRHQMETSSVLLAICAGNSPVPGEYPAQRPVTRSFDVFFDLRPNKLLSKQSWGWWSETPSRSLWRHRNDPTHSALYNNWFYTLYFFYFIRFHFLPEFIFHRKSLVLPCRLRCRKNSVKTQTGFKGLSWLIMCGGFACVQNNIIKGRLSFHQLSLRLLPLVK